MVPPGVASGKVQKLKLMINQVHSKALIEVDGGVNLQNAPLLVKTGVDVLVAGSTVFKSENPLEIIAQLKNVSSSTLKV